MNKKLFLAMSRRRVSSPQTTQQLWDAIRITSYQRQIPDLNRITRYMSRIHGVNEDEVRRQLSYCVRDGLVRLVKRLGYKGTKIGVEQESYRLPKPKILSRDDHDWYCFECHSGGDVICCTFCYRVYHLACIEKEELPEDDVKNKFICNVCKMIENSDSKLKIKRGQLNKLLIFTCARLKEKLPATIMDRMVPSNTSFISDRTSSVLSHQRRASGVASDPNIKWVTDEGDSWRIRNLIYSPMDLETMEKKALKNKYKSLEQFQADAQTIVHNVVIYHGDGSKTRMKRDGPWVHSPLADMARQMLRDCIYDLQEIRQCRDCYRMSNEKSDRHWFCQPCRPPHQLVYAKQKGFPYWPAKVIKVENDQYDVRFFGGYHQRALIEKTYIRQISVNIHSLQVKRTSSWNKACEELKRHQEFLEDMRERTDDFTNFESSEDEPPEEEDSEDENQRQEKDEDEADEELEEEQEEEHDGDDEDTKTLEKSSETVKEAPAPEPEPEPEPPTPPTPNIPKKRGRKRKAPTSEGSMKQNGAPIEEDASISTTTVKRKSKKDGISQEDMVTSSCEEPSNRSFATQTHKKSSPTSNSKDISKAVKEALEKQRREFEAEKAQLETDRTQAVSNAVRSLEQDIARLQAEHSEVLADLEEKHKANVSDVKKKQWCYNCEQEAIYHCCWNTAYCSTDCQQLHWQKEHKRVCRRKR